MNIIVSFVWVGLMAIVLIAGYSGKIHCYTVLVTHFASFHIVCMTAIAISFPISEVTAIRVGVRFTAINPNARARVAP
jgi:hypothetical protein